MFDDVVKLTEGALTGNFLAEARCRGAGITFEHGDRGVLVLDFAGHRSERAIGDIPGDRATELARGEAPGLPVRAVRDGRLAG